MANTYTIGQQVRFTGTFKNNNGVVTDPTAITFKYVEPGVTATTLVYGTDAAVVKESTGIYHVDVTLDSEGVWTYRWEGTGTLVTAGDGWCKVLDSVFY